MDEIKVQTIYDIMKSRISMINYVLSEDSTFQSTSNKMKKRLSDVRSNLQKYVDEIDRGLHGDMNDELDSVLADLYFNTLCPNEKG